MEEVKEDTDKKEEEPAEQEKEAKGEEKVKEKAKKEEVTKVEAKKEKPVKEKKTEKKAEEAKGSKRQKTMQCKVTLLDDTQFECELDVRNLPNYIMLSCVCGSPLLKIHMVMKTEEYPSPSVLSVCLM